MGKPVVIAVLALGYAAALLLVLVVLPTRFSPASTDTEASVSLAAPSAAEIAFLLGADLPGGTAAFVTEYDEETVTVVAFGEAWRNERGELHAGYVSWNRYVLEHVVARADLEAALGRALTAADVATPTYRAITYRSAWLPLYVAAEVLVLGGLFSLGLGVLVVVSACSSRGDGVRGRPWPYGPPCRFRVSPGSRATSSR